MPKNRGVILFVKYPEPGKVKTRIAKTTGDTAASGIYAAFVADILFTLDSVESETLIYYNADRKRSDYRSWLGNDRLYFPQNGNDIGEIMKNALVEQFDNGYDRLLLVGSDIPDISTRVIHRAFACLITSPCVIGPATDGGYYLIGFRQNGLAMSVFEDIGWSAPTVLRETRAKLDEAGSAYKLLPKCEDMDTFEDIRRYYNGKKQWKSGSSETLDFIERNLSPWTMRSELTIKC